MSLTLLDGKDCRPLAVIRGKSDKKLNNEILYTTMDDGKHNMQSLELECDMKYQPIPDITMERCISYVAGKSGSGKSTYCANWLREYKKIYPDNPIFLFSEVDSDEILDAVGLERIKIDTSLVTHPITLEQFEDSCIVFDDVDDIDDAKIRKAVFGILNKGLQMGRHHRISMLVTYHLITNGKETRKILNEAHTITIFPRSGKVKGMKYFLTEYLDLDREQKKKLRSLPSRWVMIKNTAPMCVLSEHDAYILKDNDDSSDDDKPVKKRR